MEKRCLECGKEIVGKKRKDLRYCGPSCRYQAWARVNRPNAVDVFKVVLRHTRKSRTRGEIIEAWLGNEKLASSWSPEFEVCRILKAKGLQGYVQFWRDGKDHYDFGMSIEWGAKHCVAGANTRFSRWEPDPRFSGTEDECEEVEA